MWRDAHDTYLESRILSADPVELVRVLYQAATGAVRDARRHLAGGEIAARSQSISKACEILFEQDDAPLAEVHGLLSTLSEAWDGVKPPAHPAPPAENPWVQPLPQEPAPAYASSGWSL